MYQVQRKIIICYKLALIPPGPSKLLSIALKESPCELKNNVANGLNWPLGQSYDIIKSLFASAILLVFTHSASNKWGSQKKAVVDMSEKIAASIGFHHFFVMYFFLNMHSLQLSLIKSPPIIPHNTPFIRQAGIALIVAEVSSAEATN